MPANEQFSGLSMPVFTAFGWAGEEAALNYALEQLELFIEALYFGLPGETRSFFATHGLDQAGKNVYMATAEPPDSELYVLFNARPMSLEINMGISDPGALAKAFKLALANFEAFHSRLRALGSEWTLRIQQKEVQPEGEEATHHADLYKGAADELDLEAAKELFERAQFLTSEPSWVTPFHFSQRRSSEKIAAMGRRVLDVLGDDVASLMPAARLLTGKERRAKAKAKPKKPARKKPVQPTVEQTTIRQPSDAADLDEFVFVSELQPLHIRRGFVNLTRNHWPFFARNARSTTRDVTVKYDEHTDKKSSVWRLSSNDQARLVLSPAVQMWLAKEFEPYEQVQLAAVKQDDDKIQITLSPLS
ncbi:MAG: hypothetical protein R3300_15425 [Candidatus Promineifilaceae bacterium]|nr:hypothetical protein [Candidatus Promineifilaceae bacterium]